MKLYILTALILAVAFSCKKPTEPPPNGGPDTTSHNFSFVLDTLGDGNSSVLSDVFIISENNVIAVGEIFLRDSSGGFGEPPYGVARWDGTRWHFVRLTAVGPGGFTFHIAPIRGIWAFSPTDIWLAAGAVFRWNGQTITPYYINHFPGNPNPILDPGQTAEKLWGTSSSNLYAVGRQGAVARFNGSTWQKLESGTTVDIQDIWGAVDTQNGQTEILAVASNRAAVPQAKKLLRIQGQSVSTVNDSGLALALSDIWFIPGQKYFVVGDGVFHTNSLGKSWQTELKHPLFYKNSISGNALNDLMITGAYGLVSHFSGATWKHFGEAFYGQYLGADYRNGFLVSVGWIDNTAVAVRGKRTN